MAINETLESYLEKQEELRIKQEQYKDKCKELGLDTDEDAFKEIANLIDSSSLPNDKKEIINTYLYDWYSNYEYWCL